MNEPLLKQEGTDLILQHLKTIEEKIDAGKKAASLEWLDSADLCNALHISKRLLQSWRDEKKLPFTRITGKFFYKLSDIEALLHKNYSASKKLKRRR